MSTNFSRLLFNRNLFHLKPGTCTSTQKRLQSFKAALLKENDKPLVIGEIKSKKLKENQIRVQVNYCSLNSYDLALFKNNTLKDFVPGYELSGEVLEVGEKVKPDQINVGERVAVLSKNRGGFAEQCIVDSVDVWRLPSNIKRKDAAVLIFGHTNAMYAFSHLCTVKEDTNIVVSTGPAGIGLAAIDVAANIYKAKPIGVSEREELLTLVRERGAFKTVTTKSKNLQKELQGADIIYDAVGGDTFTLLSNCIKPEGKILCAGPVGSTLSTPPLNAWLSVVNFEGLRTTNPELYRELVSETLDLADEGMLSAYISAEFDLDDIDKAVQYIEENKCTGKVLIKISD